MNEKKEIIEFVYIFTNPAMPNHVKVGITNNIERRLKDLSQSTAIAEPFECFGFFTVKGSNPSAAEIEKILHFFLSGRFKQSKEYFKTSPEEVENYFLNVQILNPRLKYSRYKKDVKGKSKPTTFELLGIAPGSVLLYKPDSSVRCIVENDKNVVIFNNEKTTLSAIACGIEKRSVNGFERFVLESKPDETLWERRLRLHPNL